MLSHNIIYINKKHNVYKKKPPICMGGKRGLNKGKNFKINNFQIDIYNP